MDAESLRDISPLSSSLEREPLRRGHSRARVVTGLTVLVVSALILLRSADEGVVLPRSAGEETRDPGPGTRSWKAVDAAASMTQVG